jgi:methanogenic corrinoid protein MtbC1
MIDEHVFQRYVQSLMNGNRQQCKLIVEDLLQGDMDVKDLYTQLFQASLYEVGELWERNAISVATEHLATAVTEWLMTLAYPKIFGAEHTGKKAVIACVAGEYHQIGAKMVADTFEMNGWEGYFLGANTPTDELLRFIEEKTPHILGLSLSIYAHMELFRSLVDAVSSTYPDLSIVAGGQAFRWAGSDALKDVPPVTYISSLFELEEYVREQAA